MSNVAAKPRQGAQHQAQCPQYRGRHMCEALCFLRLKADVLYWMSWKDLLSVCHVHGNPNDLTKSSQANFGKYERRQ